MVEAPRSLSELEQERIRLINQRNQWESEGLSAMNDGVHVNMRPVYKALIKTVEEQIASHEQ